VPKPCSQPLKSNPFETYRDPVTGQWKVQYPLSTQVAQSPPLIPLEDDRPRRVHNQHSQVHSQTHNPRRWETLTPALAKALTKVA
jgi:hypothetical protein